MPFSPRRAARRAAQIAVAGAVLLFSSIGLTVTASAQQRLVVFTQPLPLWDSLWMAEAKGFYKAEGLDVVFREFPSGTTALQTFRLGEGDVNLGGDLPGVQYWLANNKEYTVAMVIERDSKGYVATSKKSITKAEDLKSKIIATRVGSTGSFFIAQYLEKNGLKPSDLTIKNLDTQVMPAALCQGDIDAFFIFQPFGHRATEICPDKVHYLSTAEGYIRGYAVAAVRPTWLKDPNNVDKLAKFIRATAKGKEVAASDFAAVAKHGKDKYDLSSEAVRRQWEINERVVAIDKTFYDDYCILADWMRKEGTLKEPLDFSSLANGEALQKVDPKLFTAPPKPC